MLLSRTSWDWGLLPPGIDPLGRQGVPPTSISSRSTCRSRRPRRPRHWCARCALVSCVHGCLPNGRLAHRCVIRSREEIVVLVVKVVEEIVVLVLVVRHRAWWKRPLAVASAVTPGCTQPSEKSYIIIYEREFRESKIPKGSRRATLGAGLRTEVHIIRTGSNKVSRERYLRHLAVCRAGCKLHWNYLKLDGFA